ncbi:MAG: gluconolaconase, partial [Acidimicrobiia bacterium]|nr:gluconolaconase [Acidimicrobiia bacterium]
MDRWTRYGGAPPRPAPGWALDTVCGPSQLWGANGIVAAARRDPGRGAGARAGGTDLYVTQVFGSEVPCIDADSAELRAFAPLGSGVDAPDDGVFGHDGTFYATAPMLSTVTARRPDGSARVLSDELVGVNGITADGEGRRLFADEFRPGGRLWELDPAGERPPRLLLDELATPNALAVGPDRGLYFPLVLPGEIWRYDLDEGGARRAFGDLAQPTAVKFDSAGRLLTSEAGTGRVVRFDLSTGAREVVAQVAPGIDNLALGADDRLFVSHFTDGRVAEVTPVGPGGTVGSERVLSPSGFVGPFGLAALDGGEVLVADGLSLAVAGPGGVRRTHLLILDLPTLVVSAAVVAGAWWVIGARGQVFRCGEGRRPEPVLGHLADPTALASDGAEGALLVERGAGRVLRLGPDGEVTGEV